MPVRPTPLCASVGGRARERGRAERLLHRAREVDLPGEVALVWAERREQISGLVVAD